MSIYIYTYIVCIWKLNPVSETAMVQHNSVDHHQSHLQKIVGQRWLAWQMLQWTPPKTKMLSLENGAWKMKFPFKMGPFFKDFRGHSFIFGVARFRVFRFFFLQGIPHKPPCLNLENLGDETLRGARSGDFWGWWGGIGLGNLKRPQLRSLQKVVQ